MKRHMLICVALLLISIAAVAQDSRGQGYLFVAPGATVFGSGGANTTGVFGFGGGGEGFLAKGLAAGGEIGYVAPYKAFGDGIGLLSANGSYHFKGSDRKVVPFLTGGYSLAFRDGSVNGANFGGGATWWAKDRLGLRLEFRDHYFPNNGDMNVLSFRIGLTFR